MVWIYLKLLIALVLVGLPFAIKYLLRPYNKGMEGALSFPAILNKKMPGWRRNILHVLQIINGFLRKASVSKKHRHFFRLILIMAMLGVQVVSNKAGQEAITIASKPSFIESQANIEYSRFSFLSENFYFVTGLEWFYNNPLSGIIAFVFTILLFRKKLADKWLTAIHAKASIQFGMCLLICSALFTPKGEAFLLAELLYIFMMAAWVYPKFDDAKSRRYYAFKKIRQLRRNS